jgi:hypothetical protein
MHVKKANLHSLRWQLIMHQEKKEKKTYVGETEACIYFCRDPY